MDTTPRTKVTASRHAAMAYRRRFGLWPHEAAGLREVRQGRGIKRHALTSLYDGHVAGMCSPGDGDGRWMTVCETHGRIASHHSIATARSFLSHPAEWCEDCAAMTREAD